MMSDFRGGGGSKMTPKIRIIEGKNRIKGGRGGRKWPKKIGHHLCMIPKHNVRLHVLSRGLGLLYEGFFLFLSVFSSNIFRNIFGHSWTFKKSQVDQQESIFSLNSEQSNLPLSPKFLLNFNVCRGCWF